MARAQTYVHLAYVVSACLVGKEYHHRCYYQSQDCPFQPQFPVKQVKHQCAERYEGHIGSGHEERVERFTSHIIEKKEKRYIPVVKCFQHKDCMIIVGRFRLFFRYWRRLFDPSAAG